LANPARLNHQLIFAHDLNNSTRVMDFGIETRFPVGYVNIGLGTNGKSGGTMPESRQIKKQKKKVTKKKENEQEQPERLSKDKQEKLKDLDSFIEGVLEEAGEDFLDQFKQIEGE
jgi:hypothetical protein